MTLPGGCLVTQLSFRWSCKQQGGGLSCSPQLKIFHESIPRYKAAFTGVSAEGFLLGPGSQDRKAAWKVWDREFPHTGYFGESRGQGSALGAVQVAGTEMTLGGSLGHCAASQSL